MPHKRKDITGQRFGKLVAVRRTGVISGQRISAWECKCDCGGKITVRLSSLNGMHTRSCGCIKKPDLVGRRFGMLLVKERVGHSNTQHASLWRCECMCGGKSVVAISNLRSGHTTSCGCKHRTHGYAGKIPTPEYRAWQRMHERCGNDNHIGSANYKGRGIKVCDRWGKFENFISDMGRMPKGTNSLDRKDNDSNYEPDNCRWSYPKQQVRNRRCTIFVDYLGERKPLGEWCEILGVKYQNGYRRIVKYGWSPERAFSEP